MDRLQLHLRYRETKQRWSVQVCYPRRRLRIQIPRFRICGLSCDPVGGAYANSPPTPQVVGIESDTEDIGRKETELSGSQSNDANDHAVQGGHHPSLPKLSAHQ